MAEHYPIAHPAVDPVEHHINCIFDRLIFLLNRRRAELLQYVRDTREDKRAAERERLEMIFELTEGQEVLHTELRENILQPMNRKWIAYLECKKRESILDIPVEVQLELKCVTRELERSISRLGEIAEVSVYVPHYATCHAHVVATGKEGRAPGELNNPRGVAIHEETHQIFVANQFNHRVEIFSETGEFFHQLGVGQLSEPWGIAIHGDSIYVSCTGDDTVSKFSLTELCLVRRIGGWGSDNGQFNHPLQLTTDSIGLVFIADTGNHRICIHDPDLNHLRNITHPSMSRPWGVKVSHDRLYVLYPLNNPCLLVLTLDGDKLHSLITRGEGRDVLRPLFFCLDPLNNFVLSDYKSHSIRVFSPEGNLLHTIGREGHQQGMFYKPEGVAVTPNGKLVCVSRNKNYGLQMFS